MKALAGLAGGLLAAAQANVDAIAAEMRAVTTTEDILTNRLDDMRSQHRRDIWTNIVPLDILQHIFEQCTISSAEIVENFGLELPAYTQAAAPFAIATTCSHWRSSSTCDATPLDVYLHAPLDISLYFADYEDNPSGLGTIIDALTAHATRMRSFELWLPYKYSGAINLDQLKAPTPLLERCCIIGQHSESDEDERRNWGFYFAHAPKLQWLEMRYVKISCSPLPYRFENLRDLLLWGTYPEEHVRRLATASSTTLQRLVMTECHQSQQCVSLQNLTVLRVYEVPPLVHLRFNAPRVHSLELKASILVRGLAPFLNQFVDRVTTLTVSGPHIPEHCLDVLQAWYNIENLICEEGNDTADWDSFFGHLAESPSVWPKLCCIRSDEGTGTQLRDGLVKLVHARSASVTEGDATENPPRPAKLVQVDIADSGAPA
ncbi:hypothetical protein EXIGLDRAFT_764980 [Exidia glandulosa HHB12029]|uniref:F-box domain-containing protein n=1 Tax=Exidia glandulosa HHB12029 TaxID=1314781 RepID=A0A165KUA4_EXIGL|nr:hypothetical protein EXIGLDRAFT_764980 [Exidia glandulosa HHB12029]